MPRAVMSLHVARALAPTAMSRLASAACGWPAPSWVRASSSSTSRVLRLAAVRLVQRLLGAGVLAHAGVAAAEADQRVDRVGIGLEGLPVERLGGLVVAGVGRALREPLRGAAAARPEAAARAGGKERQGRYARRQAVPYRVWILAIADRLVLDLAAQHIIQVVFCQRF